MTTKGNYVWKLIYTSEKQYQVYRNSVLVASGKVENLPADTKFSITSKVNNEKFSLCSLLASFLFSISANIDQVKATLLKLILGNTSFL
ncbi:hypothetical protein P4H42_01080 [Paenibacillus macerans]|uniref:hypothetical protein n=2 Tax=Paenibacillus TaxID=44249 RepID=UPI002DC02556|nr:hypothetical protein [Paenibacillus macerans]MEC0328219.1 hypothetical protein [Paenibacillus macerans]